TPLSQVRSGFVLVQGKVLTAPASQAAPLSGTPCAAAHSRISDVERIIVERTSASSFVIDDGTGRARVEVGEAHTHLSVSRTWRRTVPEGDLDARAQAFWRPG